MSVVATFQDNDQSNTLSTPVTLGIEVIKTPDDIAPRWEELQKLDTNCIYQNLSWVTHAYAHIESDNEPLILHGHQNGETFFILPLVVERGVINTIRWPGKNHANICSGLYSDKFLSVANRETMDRVIGAIAHAAPPRSILQLGNQPPRLGKYPNPMALLPNQTSTNMMFDMDLSEGMDAILDAGNGKRKRKLFRRQVREAAKLGPLELTSPKTKEEIEASLSDFYEQKALRFAEMGVRDVFGPPEVKAFIKALMLEPEKDGVKLQRFFELKIAGKTRAMYGCSMIGDYCQAWVNSVTYDEFADYSPGEMVLYMMIEQLIEEGYKRFDLGVGTERYKISWCNSMNPLFDVIMPLSTETVPYVAATRLKIGIKSKIRNDDRFWVPIKKFRKWKASLKAR